MCIRDRCIRFFDDLCAVTELRTMEQRYAVAGCLLQGKVYSEIRRETCLLYTSRCV